MPLTEIIVLTVIWWLYVAAWLGYGAFQLGKKHRRSL